MNWILFAGAAFKDTQTFLHSTKSVLLLEMVPFKFENNCAVWPTIFKHNIVTTQRRLFSLVQGMDAKRKMQQKS